MNFNTRKFFSAARFALLGACALALAACATGGTGPTAADAPKAEIATAPKTETPRTQVAKPSEPVRETEPMTRSSAARECWMRTEKGNTREDLDKRADFVNKCIDEKMKAASTPAPNT
ncbi:MAG: hypothetical protein WCD56_20600 [Pseudolabrys sp.]|jgi:hypothetical protein